MKQILTFILFLILFISCNKEVIENTELEERSSYIDIRPLFLPTNGTYLVGEDKDHVVRIRNLGTDPSIGTILFFIPNVGGYTVLFDSAQTVADLFVGTTTVNNADWAMTNLPNGKKYTSTVSIPAGGESRVAFNYKAITSGASGIISVTIGSSPNNGGDNNTTNNTATKYISTAY